MMRHAGVTSVGKLDRSFIVDTRTDAGFRR
jgi:hypothetical protein